jgi:phosphohistidine phosphatase
MRRSDRACSWHDRRVIGLHLLRHAHAGDPERWHGDDAERPLSEKGRRQAERLGRLLAASDDAPDLFITSPKVRARETAEIVAGALKVPVVVDRRLGGGLDLSTLSEILTAHADGERPCVVGHDPDFSELLGALLGLATVPMRKGAIARVDVSGRALVAGRGQLRYLLPPEVVPGK